MHRIHKTLGLFVVGLVVSISANLALADESGKALYEAQCLACHGQNGEGNEALNSPALAAQSAAYLERQLANFSNGVRAADDRDTYGKQMIPMSASLNDDSRAQLAAYASSLSAATASEFAGDLTRGEKYYQSYCGSCHGADAAGNEILNSPKLSGISGVYLERQYQYFLDGVRGQHSDDKFGRQMALISQGMKDPEIVKDVIAYIVSLK